MQQYVTVGKIRNSPFKMGYKVYGNGNEKVLLIMGVMSKGSNWKSTVNYFNSINSKSECDKYSVCIFDHVGVGESEFSSLWGVNNLATDSIELLDHLKWYKDVNIIGLSMGSLVAFEMATIIKDQSRIKSINLSSITPNLACDSVFEILYQSPKLNYFNLSKGDGTKRLITLKLDSLLYDIDESKLISQIMFSQSYLESDSKIGIGKNKDFVVPISGKLSKDLESTPWYVKLAHVYTLVSYRKPKKDIINFNKTRTFPIVLFYGTCDSFSSWKQVIKTINLISPDKVYFCKNAGHALYAEDISIYNEKVVNFFNYNQTQSTTYSAPITNKTRDPIFETLEYNSKNVSIKNHFQFMDYEKTPIFKLPIIQNCTNHTRNSYYKFFGKFIFPNLKKVFK